jgi:endo-1,4-beta-D-glucanase Y
MKLNLKKVVLAISLFLGLFIFPTLTYASIGSFAKPTLKKPIVFSSKTMLNELWERYKEEYIEAESFRTLDKQRNNISTSEGQSYTMLRAVFMDDKETFDKSWEWTRDVLRRDPEDHLFSWIFGEKEDGSYGVLTNRGGYNTASDGDTDIALALIFAYSRWNDPEYLNEAKLTIKDIWTKEVIIIHNKPYLTANNVEKDILDDVLINPSYLAPYAYRIFAIIDPENPWSELVNSSYEVLEKASTSNLNFQRNVNIPPDWLFLDLTTGEIKNNYDNNSLTSNFGFDAMRVPWRIALDWVWFEEPRAKSLLMKYSFLKDQWLENNMIYSTYDHQGIPVLTSESPAMYGAIIGYFMISEPTLIEEVYKQKLQPLYSPDKQGWEYKLGYYDDNWAWFGLAIYHKELPNLALNLKDE